jgi:hypothetical protein
VVLLGFFLALLVVLGFEKYLQLQDPRDWLHSLGFDSHLRAHPEFDAPSHKFSPHLINLVPVPEFSNRCHTGN